MRAESWSAGMGQGPGLACVPAIAIERGPAAAMAGSEGEGRPWFLGCSGVLGGGWGGGVSAGNGELWRAPPLQPVLPLHCSEQPGPSPRQIFSAEANLAVSATPWGFWLVGWVT